MGFLAAVEEDDVGWWTDRRLSCLGYMGFETTVAIPDIVSTIMWLDEIHGKQY
jgi:hypothetical protein